VKFGTSIPRSMQGFKDTEMILGVKTDMGEIIQNDGAV